MYKNPPFIVAFFCAVLISYAFSYGIKSKVLWLASTTHDFGKIPKNEPAKFQFGFINISDTPITIDNVRFEAKYELIDTSEKEYYWGLLDEVYPTFQMYRNRTSRDIPLIKFTKA